ncbi:MULTISPECIES: hypothetical protein [Cyanophyceae]|nr:MULTISPECIES: hypothetical protein [Cyanophyceae]
MTQVSLGMLSQPRLDLLHTLPTLGLRLPKFLAGSTLGRALATT